MASCATTTVFVSETEESDATGTSDIGVVSSAIAALCGPNAIHAAVVAPANSNLLISFLS